MIELLLILVLLGIISIIAIMTIGNVIENSRIKADESNLATLNEATQNYIFLSNVQTQDAFEGINSDYFRIEHLYELDYIDQLVIASQQDAEFRWNVITQMWELYGGSNPYNVYYDSYDFSDMTLEDAVGDGLLVVNDSYIAYNPDEGYVEILQQSGMLLKDTTEDEYSFSVLFSTSNESDTRPVFYFDYNDDADNLAKGEGFAILFNRANAFVRIFTISNGTTYSNSTTYYYTGAGVIPTVSEDASWYGNPHTFYAEITRINSSTKQISIYIDEVFLYTFQYSKVLETETVYYGPNVRGNGAEIYIHQFD